MDLDKLIKKEEESLDKEDTNENYLKLDFEIGVKVENDSPVFDDWCVQNTDYQEPILCEELKREGDVNTCLICFRMFADSYALYKHNITHLVVAIRTPSLYQCSYCLCYCTSRASIKEHIQSKHYKKLKTNNGCVTHQEHECSICKKTYTYKRWHAHMREVHGSDQPRCGICNKTFKCLTYLRRHLLYVHEKVKKPGWRCHKKIELGKEYKCELCPSVFQNRNSRKTHIRNCHSTEVHECPVCHSKLKSAPYLRTHMKRVHYNDGKSHKCDICWKEFRSPRYLNIHKKNSHDVKVKSKKFDGRRIYKVESGDTSDSS